MSVRRKKESSMVKAVTMANDGIVDGCGWVHAWRGQQREKDCW